MFIRLKRWNTPNIIQSNPKLRSVIPMCSFSSFDSVNSLSRCFINFSQHLCTWDTIIVINNLRDSCNQSVQLVYTRHCANNTLFCHYSCISFPPNSLCLCSQCVTWNIHLTPTNFVSVETSNHCYSSLDGIRPSFYAYFEYVFLPWHCDHSYLSGTRQRQPFVLTKMSLGRGF